MSSSESSPPVTQRDVARALGLSHSTVSLALRNSPKITKERRDQIAEAAERMGYRPNPAASALAHLKRSSSVVPIRAALAWLNFWPNPKELRRYAEFDRYWQGASSAAEKLGYRLEEFVREPGEPPERIERILYHRGISGILLPPHQIRPDWGGFHWERFSTVRFGRSIESPRVHLVTADQVANSVLAFNEIRQRGYDRVGMVVSRNRAIGHLFEAGFLQAQRFVPAALRLPIFTVTDPRKDRTAFSRWLKTHRPDAIFTDHPETPGILKAAGYRVPDDIGLAATSIIDVDVDAGIDQNAREIGRVGLLVLVSLIGDNDRGIPPIFRQVLVEGVWVDGQSLPRRGSAATDAFRRSP